MNLEAGRGSKHANAVLYPVNYSQSFVKEFTSAKATFGEDISRFLQPDMQYGHDAIVELLLRLSADINTLSHCLAKPL